MRNINKDLNKSKKFIQILILTIATLLLNILLASISGKIHFMGFMDSLFTVTLTFYAGLIPGLFASALASCLSASLLDTFIRPLFGKPSGFGITDNFSYSFQNQNMGSFLSYFLPRIPITLLDRLICTFGGYWIYKLINKKKEMS